MTEKDMITMSRRETKRLHIIHQAMDKRITQEKTAELVGLSGRQLRRMIKRVREEGDDGISHRSRGKISHRRVPQKIKEKTLKLFREKYSDFGPTFASEKLLDVHEIKVSKETLRLWLNEEVSPMRSAKGESTGSGARESIIWEKWSRWMVPIMTGSKAGVLNVY